MLSPMMCAAMSVLCFCVWLYTAHGAKAASSPTKDTPLVLFPAWHIVLDCPSCSWPAHTSTTQHVERNLAVELFTTSWIAGLCEKRTVVDVHARRS